MLFELTKGQKKIYILGSTHTLLFDALPLEHQKILDKIDTLFHEGSGGLIFGDITQEKYFSDEGNAWISMFTDEEIELIRDKILVNYYKNAKPGCNLPSLDRFSYWQICILVNNYHCFATGDEIDLKFHQKAKQKQRKRIDLDSKYLENVYKQLQSEIALTEDEVKSMQCELKTIAESNQVQAIDPSENHYREFFNSANTLDDLVQINFEMSNEDLQRNNDWIKIWRENNCDNHTDLILCGIAHVLDLLINFRKKGFTVQQINGAANKIDVDPLVALKTFEENTKWYQERLDDDLKHEHMPKDKFKALLFRSPFSRDFVTSCLVTEAIEKFAPNEENQTRLRNFLMEQSPRFGVCKI